MNNEYNSATKVSKRLYIIAVLLNKVFKLFLIMSFCSFRKNPRDNYLVVLNNVALVMGPQIITVKSMNVRSVRK